MSKLKLLILHAGVRYRFLKIDRRADGSLIVLMDRDKKSSDTTPSAKFSIHTTGMLHRYQNGQRSTTTHIEPLYQLPESRSVGYISIPCPSLLDPLEGEDETSGFEILIIPEEISERVTFSLEIGPDGMKPISYGIALHYEIYSLILRVIQSPTGIPQELSKMFLYASAPGTLRNSAVKIDEAELAFHQTAHKGNPPLFRGKGGDYILLARVPMCRTPSLNIKFNRSDLYFEQIPFDGRSDPTHKVRFYICDKGGRNKTTDLTSHITEFELDAEL